MKHVARLALVLLGSVACAPPLRAPAKQAVVRPAPVVRSPSAELPIPKALETTEPVLAPALPFSVAYERACNGSVTGPLVSPSGARVLFCRAAYTLADGRFLGLTPLGPTALVSDEEAFFDTYSGGFERSPVLSRLRSRAKKQLIHATNIVANPALDRFASIEGSRIVVRSIAKHETLLSAPVRDDDHVLSVAFLSNGDAIAHVARGCATKRVSCPKDSGSKGRCTETKCASQPVLLVHDGELTPMGPGFDDVQSIAVSPSGTRAVLVRGEDAAIVDLPKGGVLFPLKPSWAHLHHSGRGPSEGVAFDATATRVAIATESDGVVLLDLRNPKEPRQVATRTSIEVEQVALVGDGHTLLVSDGRTMEVLREGEPPHPSRRPEYLPTLPRGFRAPLVRNATLTFSNFDDSSETVPRGMVARYRHTKKRIDVTVTASDAAEFGPATEDVEAWSRAILEKEDTTAAGRKVARTPNGRVFEMVRFVRDGCDPSDDYVRFMERGSLLYRIDVRFPPRASKRSVTPVLHTFFDAPTGDGDFRRVFVKPTPTFPGPC